MWLLCTDRNSTAFSIQTRKIGQDWLITNCCFVPVKGRGAPIGNLTTQLFANFYMADFDAYMMDRIKELRAKGIRCAYHRFVDDFILICSDKKALRWLIKAAEIKIKAMEVTMHKDKRYIQPTSHGTMFVGSYFKEWSNISQQSHSRTVL